MILRDKLFFLALLLILTGVFLFVILILVLPEPSGTSLNPVYLVLILPIIGFLVIFYVWINKENL